ncbi:MAG TPA: O-antigen polymerase [Burkholderiales bacterium]|nr:O-antigen polymerase [Burkholderiales bacterium]
MTLAFALLLAALFAAPLFAHRRGRASARAPIDLLAPARVTAVFHLVTIVPYLLLVALDESVVDPLVRQNADVGELQPAIAWYALVQAVGFLALLAGTRSRRAARLAGRLPVIATDARPQRERLAIACALAISGIGFAVFVAQVGGLDFLLRNLDRRTALTAGAGYVLSLLNLLFFAIAIAIVGMRRRRTALKWAFLGALVLAAAIVFSSLGGRKATLLIFVSGVFAWHYGVRPIRRVRFRHLLPAVALVPYFVIMPILRSPGGFEYFSRNPGALATEIAENITVAVTDLSYVDTYLYVTNAFHAHDVWWGATYRDLLKAPVPSTLDDSKPPLDDGVYVRTLAGGMRAEPGMAFKQLFYSSWPPETLGATYMNFWLPGVVVGMWLLGAVYRLAYAYMRRSRCTLYSIVVYAHVVVSFHLSNLRIVQAVVYLTITTLFFGLLFGFRARRRRVVRVPRLAPVARLAPSGPPSAAGLAGARG